MIKEKQKYRAFSRGRTAKGDPNPIKLHYPTIIESLDLLIAILKKNKLKDFKRTQ